MKYHMFFKHAICTAALFVASCSGKMQKAAKWAPRLDSALGMQTNGVFAELVSADTEENFMESDDSYGSQSDMRTRHTDSSVRPHEHSEQSTTLSSNGYTYARYEGDRTNANFDLGIPVKSLSHRVANGSFLHEEMTESPIKPVSFAGTYASVKKAETTENPTEKAEKEPAAKPAVKPAANAVSASKKSVQELTLDDLLNDMKRSKGKTPAKAKAPKKTESPDIDDILKGSGDDKKTKDVEEAKKQVKPEKEKQEDEENDEDDEEEEDKDDEDDDDEDDDEDDDLDMSFDIDDDDGFPDIDASFKRKSKTKRNNTTNITKRETTREYRPTVEPVNTENSKLNPGLAAAMRYLGSGYDIVFGNPLGDPVIMVDPGYRNPVLKLDWSEDYHNHDGANLKEPRGGWIRPEMSCRQAESVEHVNSIDDYKKELSVDAKLSVDMPFYFSFSASSGYKNFVKTMSANTMKNYIIKTYCLRYVAGVQDFKNIEVQPSFKTDVDDLPDKFDEEKCKMEVYKYNDEDEKCADSVRPWMRFFQKYGTHYTTVIHLGGKVTHQIQMAKTDVASLQKEGFNIDLFIKSKAGVPFVSGETGVSTNNSTQSSSKMQNYNTEKLIIVIGGDTPTDGAEKESMAEWTRSLYRKPMPIKVNLDSLKTLIQDPKKKQIFEVALKYYSEVYGISPDEMYAAFEGREKGVALMTQRGRAVFYYGRQGGSAVCPDKKVIIMGYALVITRVKNTAFSDWSFHPSLTPCPVGQEKCVVNNPPPASEVRIWILCAETPIPLLIQEVATTEGSPATAACPKDYAIAYGFGLSIPKGLNVAFNDLYACRTGQQSCTHSSPNTKRNTVWIACVEKNAPEIGSISNLTAVTISPNCQTKNGIYRDNVCPASYTMIASWKMNIAKDDDENVTMIDKCAFPAEGPKLVYPVNGCRPESVFNDRSTTCKVQYSWIACWRLPPIQQPKKPHLKA
ncbi:MAC/perforin domain containing protein [Babesia caballi]|uniref:MAC/perforin domain containing protein n=1 Tax=Babesia caballi TaxID=5871 RepID=A0AAV4LZV1_BABCB|nr:MAC/perforin domain containing protein [Babesia caballi]